MTCVIAFAADLFHLGDASFNEVVKRCCMGGRNDLLQPPNLLIAVTP